MGETFPSLSRSLQWKASRDWTRVVTIDAHTAGEPLRIFLDGLPEIPGNTILARRRFFQDNLDHLRTALMWEPRGHADMYGCIVVPPETADADFGVLFTHNEGYSSMCGHGIIAVVTALIETGACPCKDNDQYMLRIDTPAGRVNAIATIRAGRVATVTFENVPSFVVESSAVIQVPGQGDVVYDLAYGGAFYAYVAGDQFDPPVSCLPQEHDRMIHLGRLIKQHIIASRTIEHPFESDLGFLYGTIFIAPPQDPAHHSRNCCIFADGQLDRSPTGTGVSGRAAIHHLAGEVKPGETMTIESVLGTCFDVQVARETTCGPYRAVIPAVAGRAFITGRHEFLIDPDDPLAMGFMFR
jgi:trans-L-3-hydroxyproline dehydratase